MLKMGEHWCEHDGCMSWGAFGSRKGWFCKEHKDVKNGKPDSKLPVEAGNSKEDHATGG